MGRRKRAEEAAEEAAKEAAKLAKGFEAWWESLERRAFGPSDPRVPRITPAHLKAIDRILKEKKNG